MDREWEMLEYENSQILLSVKKPDGELEHCYICLWTDLELAKQWAKLTWAFVRVLRSLLGCVQGHTSIKVGSI